MSNVSSALALPPDVADYLLRLDEGEVHARQLLTGLSDEQANWRPNQGASWSIAACLKHMAITNTTYLTALQAAVDRAKPGHVPLATAGWPSRFFLQKTEPPVSVKIKAPKKIQPPDKLDAREALGHFIASIEAVRQFAIQTASLDLGSVRFKNPFLPGLNFTIATGLLIVAAHMRRHLWQADQVRRASDFPA